MEVWLRWQLDDLKASWPDCRWLFHYRGRRIGAHLKGWKKACETVALAGLLFHDLRRTAVRNMERVGIPRSVAMAISGHRTESVYKRYDILSPRDLKLASAKLEAYIQELAAPAKAAKGERHGQSDQSGAQRDARKPLN